MKIALPRVSIRVLVGVALLALTFGCGGGGDNGGNGGPSGGPCPGATAVVYGGDAVQYNLDVLNAYRACAGSPAIALDVALNAYATTGSNQLMATHVAHGHFIATNGGGCTPPFNTACAENQGDPNGWPAAAINVQIDQILAAMWAEGPGGGHFDNMVNPLYTRLGVGLVVDGLGELYFTNDFSN